MMMVFTWAIEAAVTEPITVPDCKWSWRSFGCVPADVCKLKWKPRFGSFGPCEPRASSGGLGSTDSCDDEDKATFVPTQKEHFDSVYDLPDPRPYYNGLLPTAYRIPFVVASAVRSLAGAGETTPPLRVIDFACGYGAVGAMLRHNLTMDELYSHYSSTDWQADTPLQYRELDREWYARRHIGTHISAIELTGLDVAHRALAYAADMGLVDAIAHENLVEVAPSASLRERLVEADLVIEAGSVGHDDVQLGVFRSILATGARPWFLRVTRPDVDTQRVEALLATTGYVTSSLGPLIRYRKPLGAEEEARVLALIVSEHHCDWQQHCLVLGPGETLPERCILLLPARRYQQEVNYSDMFTPATTKRNQRRSPLAAQNYRLTDGRTVRSAIWRRQSTHRPPRACPLPTLDAGAAASRARDEHRPLLSKHCAPQRAAAPSGHRRGARLECCTVKCPASSANRSRRSSSASCGRTGES